MSFVKMHYQHVDYLSLHAVVVCYSYTSTTCTPTSATATGGGSLAVKSSPRPPSPASNVVLLPSGSTVYVKSE